MSVDPDLVDMMNAVFAEHRDDPQLWTRLDALGLVRLTGSEASGGSGAGWPEAAELISAAVRNGIRIPLAEHDLLACWLLETAGLPVDGAVRTVAVLDESAVAQHVPWAQSAERLVLAWPSGAGFQVAEALPGTVAITAGVNQIGEPRDTVTADLAALTGVEVSADVVAGLRRRSALVKAVAVCAALDAALAMSVEHVSSRVQFGRTLSKFQALQNMIADMAAEAALARAATEAALDAAINSDWSGDRVDFLVAVARSCAGHAASVVVRNAHQIHGALGTTSEHRLHEVTRSALVWRSECGSVRHWDRQVADAAADAGAAGLWALIAG